MRMICLGVLLVVSTLSSAEDSQTKWSCAGVSSIGFKWENGNWEDSSFFPTNYLFTIATGSGAATLMFEGYQWSFSNCRLSNVALCTSSQGNSIIMNLTTGQGAVSSIVATAVPPDGAVANSYIERIQCSRS